MDDEDWPERATPLALPNLDAALEPGESPEDGPTPCVHLEPFRVGPGVMDLAPMRWEKLRVGFAPPGPGEFTREFRLVCDNCQVRTFAVRGRGAVLDVAVTRVDDRDAVPGEFANHAVWFGDDVEPGRVKTRRFTVRNATPVPLPFEWEHPSEEGVFVVAPARDVGAERRDGIRRAFAPREVASYERRFKLLVDCAFPPREPLNGAAMFERPVEVESVLVAGAGRARDVVVDANLVNFAGALLPGRHYDREIRLTNRGDAACAFAWRGQDDFFARDETDAGDGVGAGVPAVRDDRAGGVGGVRGGTRRRRRARCDRTLVCVCEHGPELFVRVTAEVEGPEVVFAQSSLDFGLLQRGVPGDAYLVLRNASPVPAAWTLEERRDFPAAADATTPTTRNPRGEIRFSVSRGVLPPHAEVEVECTLTPSEEGAYRGVVACVAGGGRVAVVDARADVLRPRCALSETLANLGVCHVGCRWNARWWCRT